MNVGEGCTTIVDGTSIDVAVSLPMGVMLCGIVDVVTDTALDTLGAFVEVIRVTGATGE